MGAGIYAEVIVIFFFSFLSFKIKDVNLIKQQIKLETMPLRVIDAFNRTK